MSLVIINSYLIFLFFFDIMHCEPLKMVTNPSHQCLRCDYSATRKSILQKHMKSIHEGKKYPCSQCESTFTQTGSLKRHIKTVHNGLKFPCTQCESTFTEKRRLQTHIKSVHEGQTFFCTHCGHWNFWPSWIDFMCRIRLLFWVDLCSQCGHWNFWSSWTDFTWLFPKPIIAQVFMMVLYESTYTW